MVNDFQGDQLIVSGVNANHKVEASISLVHNLADGTQFRNKGIKGASLPLETDLSSWGIDDK